MGATGAAQVAPCNLTGMLVVQERLRFYRESMTACLSQQLIGIDVILGVADADTLLEVLGSRRLTYAVIEADKVPWDIPALVAGLRRSNPTVKVIGLFATARPVACEALALLPRGASPEQIAELVQPGLDRPVPFVLTASASNGHGPLTAQQLRVLALLSLGLTVAEVAARLGLSERGVVKSKTAIYSKLGVQSQAQAVATALAAGLLGPAPGSQSA